MKQVTLLVTALITIVTANAQNTFPSTGAAGIGTTAPNASALLEVKSTTKGVLISRMTKAQRDAIVSAATGLLIFQTNSTPGFYYYSGTGWTAVSTVGANKSLSNLTSPTSISADLLPAAINTRNLGSSTSAWKDLYLAGDVYLNNNRFVSGTGTQNAFVGALSGYSISTGQDNVGLGYYTLSKNTTGSANTATGSQALYFNTGGNSNTALGYQSLYSNTTGHDNTATGALALYNNTTGFYNSAHGAYALYNNTNGNYNTATGFDALAANSTGSTNTASGYNALRYNTTGYSNTAHGAYALQSNTTGIQNIAVGDSALYSNDTGPFNVALGAKALQQNTSGGNNVAVGSQSLTYNTIGSNNTAVGYWALRGNTTGSNNTANGFWALRNNEGSNNTANGYWALRTNNSGSNNTANGFFALDSNGGGSSNVAMGAYSLFTSQFSSFNTAIGDSAMFNYNDESFDGYNAALGHASMVNTTTGYKNTAIGNSAMLNNATGHNNTALGSQSDVSTGNLTNATAIGANAIVNGSNKVVIGSNTPGMVIGGYAPWTTIVSDGRFKENVKEDIPGLKFITKLRPVTYTVNTRKLNEHIMQKMPDSIKEKRLNIFESFTKVSNKIQTGFIAQEVEKTAKELGYDFDGVNAPQNETDNYSIAYSQFVIPLVKAVQELSKLNDKKDSSITQLQKQNSEQEKQIDDLKSRLDKIEKLISQQSINNISPSKQSSQTVELGMAAKLEQNIPNPFTNTTIIHYYVPVNNRNAYINFYNTSGALLKSEKLQGTGYGNINIKARDLPAGAYQYSLIIDSRIVDAKKMVQVK